MKIVQACFSRTWNLGDRNEIAIELVATVRGDEAVETVLNQLADEARTWHANGGTK